MFQAIMPGLGSDVIACVVKLMTDDELIAVSRKIFDPLTGSKIGAAGYMGARIQPNSPTDHVDDIAWQVSGAGGDARHAVADDDLDMDPALRVCVQLALAGPHPHSSRRPCSAPPAPGPSSWPAPVAPYLTARCRNTRNPEGRGPDAGTTIPSAAMDSQLAMPSISVPPPSCDAVRTHPPFPVPPRSPEFPPENS